MRAPRFRRTASAALVVAGILTASAAGAASAASGGLSLSTDGSTYGSTVAGSLFDGLGPIVPRQHEQRTLWVRNDGDTTAVVRILATEVGADADAYGDALSLRATTARQQDGRAMPFSTDATCFVLLGEQYLTAGSAVPVTFDLTMADIGGTTAQVSSADATLVVQMRDAAAPAPADDECDGDGVRLPVLTPDGTTTTGSAPGALSQTGFDMLLWVLAAGSLLCGGLIALLGTRRRRKEES